MSGAEIAFFFFGGLAVFSALAMVTRKNAIVAAMWLIATFLSVAACYVLASATFLSAIQVIVYAGAVMVLFVFVIMVVDVDATGKLTHRRPSRVGKIAYYGGFLLSAGFLAWVLVGTLARQYVTYGAELEPGTDFGTATGLGREIFTDYVFPFEAVSLLLVAAIVGAVVVARSRKEREHAARHLTDAAARHAAGLGPHEAGDLAPPGPTPATDFGEPSGTGHRGL
ncbi:MAG: NADH-quinone oxidoreductase subunit J [Deltaproteobacteria bacterium]|nr:MAG: NADH-quinone oxidoreductase subunit J [Deltaproteobacteria bacterium]